ncbi:hypothetical protein BD309DRAFT_958663 [Dichomitus squalens]|uniref:Uncharacterized protein n=1 Tax=Dichomitus squalens TaxID=114155 RepID=A0A4Q9QC19_9APHY|nr:hypothetical protein BD309DRAFT_958663 [Dichomitus squalens]TBU65229.1 hypothetical protein BD310DRAFT_914298 [Dichomitus squalens]
MCSVVQCRLSNFSAIMVPTSDRPRNAAAVRILSREDLLFPPLCQIMSMTFSALTLLVENTSHTT